MTTFSDFSFCSNCNKHQTTFQSLNETELQLLNESKHEVHFNPGEMIFKQGSALTHIACINQGLAKLYIEGPHQKNLIIKILKCPDVVIGPGIFIDQRHHYSITAITNVKACFIDTKILLDIIKRNNDFAQDLLVDSTIKRIHNFDLLVNLTQKHMSGRIAETLIYLSQEIYQNKKFTVDISRQDIADLSAMSKESAIRIIKEFREASYITCEGNDFEILNQDALVDISKNG